MSDTPNWLERLLAAAIALAVQIIRGLLLAPVIAVRRMISSPIVREVGPEGVIDLRHRVLRPGRPREDAIWPGDELPTTRHWVVEWGGEVVGVASVFANSPPGSGTPTLQLRGMAVAPELQGRGLGRAVLDGVCAAVGEPLWCNARESAMGFYERAGWEGQGELFDIPRIGPHRRLFYTPRQLPETS